MSALNDRPSSSSPPSGVWFALDSSPDPPDGELAVRFGQHVGPSFHLSRHRRVPEPLFFFFAWAVVARVASSLGSVVWFGKSVRARGLVAMGVCEWCELGVREETSCLWSN